MKRIWTKLKRLLKLGDDITVSGNEYARFSGTEKEWSEVKFYFIAGKVFVYDKDTNKFYHYRPSKKIEEIIEQGEVTIKLKRR